MSAFAYAYANPAAGAPTTVVGGRLAWGFSQTFQGEPRSARPSITVGGGATEERDGTIDFPSAGGTYDSASGTATMKYRGTAVIAYPTGSVRVTNPTVAIDRRGSTLRADLSAATQSRPRQQADLGDIMLFGIAPTTAARTVTWAQVPTMLTAAGATVFPNGSMQGASLGPVTFAATLAAPAGPLANAPRPAATTPGGPPATSASPAATSTDCPSPTATATGTPSSTPTATAAAATPEPTDCPSGGPKDDKNGSGGGSGGTGGTNGSGDPASGDSKLAKTGGPFAPLMLLGLVLTALGAGTMLRARRRAAM